MPVNRRAAYKSASRMREHAGSLNRRPYSRGQHNVRLTNRRAACVSMRVLLTDSHTAAGGTKFDWLAPRLERFVARLIARKLRRKIRVSHFVGLATLEQFFQAA